MIFTLIDHDPEKGLVEAVIPGREEFITIMASLGYAYAGDHHAAPGQPGDHADLQGKPTFQGVFGPMRDGGRTCYKTAAAYWVITS